MSLSQERLYKALDAYLKNLKQASRQFRRLPALRQEQLTARILFALDRFKEHRRGAADAVANAVLAILSEALPAAVPPLLNLGFASLIAAIIAEGARSLAQGEDYDWVSSQLAFELTTGFAETPDQHGGPEQLLDLLFLVEAAAARAYRLAAKMLMAEKEALSFEPASLEQHLCELLQASATAGIWQVDSRSSLTAVVRGPGFEQAAIIINTAVALAAETEAHAHIRDCALRYALAGSIGARRSCMLPSVARISGSFQLSH